MHFALAERQGAGTIDNGYRPAGIDDASAWSCIDLAPGPYLVASDARPSGRGYLGEGSHERLPATLVRRLGNRLGVTFSASDLGNMAAEALVPRRTLRPTGRRYEIHLGELIWTQPYVAGGATFTDDFNRANNTSLGANWTELDGVWDISSNALVATTVSNGYAECTQAMGTNHTADVDIIAGTNSHGPIGRSDAGVSGFFMFRLVRASGVYELWRFTGGYTNIASFTDSAPALPNTLRIKCDGSTITGFLGAGTTQKVQVTDTNLASGTKGGVWAASEGTFDNFTVADIVTGPTHARTVQRLVSTHTG